ncbi:hypothetical protein ACFQ3Z_25045 [Streptomyces nogalater]
MNRMPTNTLVLNPDELGPDLVLGMDLAMKLGIGHLEIRSAEGANAVTLPADRLRHIRALADERGLKVAALASPLWKWCRPEATPGESTPSVSPPRSRPRTGWAGSSGPSRPRAPSAPRSCGSSPTCASRRS